MANPNELGIFNTIQIGKKYPIIFSKEDERLLTLQYLFKPANVACPVSGAVSGARSEIVGSSEVNVTLESGDGATENFKGIKRASINTDNECLLLFSNQTFKVQKVNEVVLNLRVQREENIAKSKESSSKESKALIDSRKLPKFLQKSQPKKRPPATTPKESSTTEATDAGNTIINEKDGECKSAISNRAEAGSDMERSAELSESAILRELGIDE